MGAASLTAGTGRKHIIMGLPETASVAISSFLVKKNVFLEPDMKSRKQRLFDGVSAFLMLATLRLRGKDVASMLALFLTSVMAVADVSTR